MFCDDYILPFGNLREPSSGKKRANMIIVTKCPKDLSEIAQQKIKEKLKVKQPVFFTTIQCDDCIFGNDSQLLVSEIQSESKVLVAGIAKPKLFFDFLKAEKDETLVFPDHHHFSKQDCEQILAKANGRKIITTEKGVLIWGGRDVPSDLPFHASMLFSRNVVNLLTLMVKPAKDNDLLSLEIDFEDEIIDKSALCHAGKKHMPGGNL